MESFGEHIRELRKECGITNYEMAKVLNVPLEILLTDGKAVDFENNPAIRSLKKRVARFESICRNIVNAGRAGRI